MLDENSNYTSITIFPLDEELPIRELSEEEYSLVTKATALAISRNKLLENPNSLFLQKVVKDLEDAINNEL